MLRDTHVDISACGFRKGYSTQYASYKASPKTAKVSWWNCWNIVNGLIKSLWLCQPWFNNCKARGIWSWQKQFKTHTKLSFLKAKVGSSFSELLEIMLAVPLGSILGPVLFNVFINDLLLFIKEIYLWLCGQYNSVCLWKRFRCHLY